QTRFLRALETGEFTPVGGRAVQRSRIRLVAATHRDLADDVARGRFRQDLYYRLRVVVISTPPLRDRPEDIPVLAAAFLADENARHGMHVRGLTRAAEQALLDHDWPGNVRELRNVLSSVVVLKQRGMIDVADLPPEVRTAVRVPSPWLPMPIDPAGRGELDLGVVASSLLEIRQELREIKAMLAAGERPPLAGGWTVGADGRLRPSGPVVETYADEAGYSPLGEQDHGDLQTAERSLIEAALKATDGNRRRAADRLGISERTLYRKIRSYGLA
ncbi:MAG TPA: sigma 54-interacting transcriptional regulator, partial [Candidatus Krumholzibacteria bacterium]|nr:sigma 54-interacting transcriptional regulator [Candidatus Krumholzibacteria bacterium]